MQDDTTVLVIRHALQHVARAVGTAVVHQNDLQRQLGATHSSNHVLDRPHFVVHGYHDGQEKPCGKTIYSQLMAHVVAQHAMQQLDPLRPGSRAAPAQELLYHLTPCFFGTVVL